jgi:hypothetical protein
VGNHYVGVSGKYMNPLFVRSYFDPTGLNLSDAFYIGYVQTLAPKILGVAVTPSVFGGDIANRPVLFSDCCVDFMWPADAAARAPNFGGPLWPFYPFNAMLRTNLNALTDFGRTSAPLGFLHFPNPPLGLTGANVAKAAALTAQINMSLLTPDMLFNASPFDIGLGGPIQLAWGPYAFPMTRSDFARKPLVQHVVDLLQQSTDQGLTDADKAIQLSDIRFSRFVGRFLLINVIDSETMDPVLCAWTEPNDDTARPVAVKIAMINYDALDDKEEWATYQFLARAAAYRRGQGIVDGVPAKSSAKGKGTPLPLAIADGQAVASISVTDTVYGMPAHVSRQSSRPTPRSGITYDLEFNFDGLGRKLVFNRLTNIRELTSADAPERAMTAYELLATTGATGTVDVSNFDLVGSPLAEPIPPPPT